LGGNRGEIGGVVLRKLNRSKERKEKETKTMEKGEGEKAKDGKKDEAMSGGRAGGLKSKKG